MKTTKIEKLLVTDTYNMSEIRISLVVKNGEIFKLAEQIKHLIAQNQQIAQITQMEYSDIKFRVKDDCS